MARKALIDLNVILDYLLEREEYESARYIMEEVFSGRLKGFLPASAVPILAYLLEREAKKHPEKEIDWKTALNIVLSHLHLVSVTGVDAIEALSSDDVEDALMVKALKRMFASLTNAKGLWCPDAIVISRDKKFPGLFRTFNSVQFVEYYKSQLDAKPTQVPLLDLKEGYQNLAEEIDNAVLSVVASAQYILGPTVEEFEKQIAEYCNAEHAVGVASGSDALLISLMSLNVGAGDEVITTPYTFFATAGSISRLGAKPVFVDIDPKTYNINPDLIEEKVTDKTKAIIPVHLYGQCAEMEPILEIAKEHNLYIIEDAAQAIGAKYKGQQAGSMGDLGCLSFYPTKNLGGYGDGGMVITNNAELAEKIRVLRVHGAKPKYYHSLIGLNSRLDALQAAVLSVKLKYLDEWSKARRQNAENYNHLFANTNVVTPYVEPHNYHIYNQYIIRIGKRNELQAFLKERNIGTEIYYPVSLHLQKCYTDLGYREGDLPESEKAAQETLALPIYSELTKEQQTVVVDTIKEFMEQ
jgi:dTDP-4-amino-4,6-dideoxygalactose transaminase/predicted nucleic acid-binding protein